MTERPLWRRLYDDVERAVAPQVEGLVRSDGFAEATAFVTKAQSAVRDQIQGATTRVWHLFNLPTAPTCSGCGGRWAPSTARCGGCPCASNSKRARRRRPGARRPTGTRRSGPRCRSRGRPER